VLPQTPELADETRFPPPTTLLTWLLGVVPHFIPPFTVRLQMRTHSLAVKICPSLASKFGFSCKYGFKLGLKLKLKHHFMFLFNFGLKPVFGFKPRFQTLVLTKYKVTHCH